MVVNGINDSWCYYIKRNCIFSNRKSYLNYMYLCCCDRWNWICTYVGVYFLFYYFFKLPRSVLVKEFRIYRVIRSSRRLQRKIIKTKYLLLSLAGLLAIEVVIDGLWLGITKPDITNGYCSTSNGIFVSIFVFYKVSHDL